jgi:hypothetical protein
MRKQSSTRTIYYISLVVVVAAVLTAFLSSPRTPSQKETSSTPSSQLSVLPAPDPKVVKSTKPEILELVSSGKSLTAKEREMIIDLLSANKIDYYKFTDAEKQLLIKALNKPTVN